MPLTCRIAIIDQSAYPSGAALAACPRTLSDWIHRAYSFAALALSETTSHVAACDDVACGDVACGAVACFLAPSAPAVCHHQYQP